LAVQPTALPSITNDIPIHYFDSAGLNIVNVSDVEDDDLRIRTSLCSCLPVSVRRCKPVDHDMTEESKYVDALLST
jgi:hypothetical protein